MTLATDKSQKTHCVKGHKFTNANTVLYPSNSSRFCRTCMDDRNREARESRLEARLSRVPDSHCPWDHEYTPETTYVTATGYRKCMTCRNLRNKLSYAKKKEERDEIAATREAFEAEVAEAMRTACDEGHGFTSTSTFVLGDDPTRLCRVCKQEADEVQRVAQIMAQITEPLCRNGHEWVSNTYTPPTGGRQCAQCRKDRKAASRAASKARVAANWQDLVDGYEAGAR